MKYLINKETKEHFIFGADAPLPMPLKNWAVLEADSEGWIAHTGAGCPLPPDARPEVKYASGHKIYNTWSADMLRWRDVKSYRPILSEKVQEPESIPAPQYDPRSVSFNLIRRLQAAHQSAQQIPDLEAELLEVLGGMGYTLGKMSPFVESANSTAVVAEPEAAVETTQDRVIAGAVFDFLGFLTTRDKPTSFGATRNASPAVKLLQEWANKRGLDLVGADVEGWCHGAKGE
jgi:hypothetical protein